MYAKVCRIRCLDAKSNTAFKWPNITYRGLTGSLSAFSKLAIVVDSLSNIQSIHDVLTIWVAAALPILRGNFLTYFGISSVLWRKYLADCLERCGQRVTRLEVFWAFRVSRQVLSDEGLFFRSGERPNDLTEMSRGALCVDDIRMFASKDFLRLHRRNWFWPTELSYVTVFF